MALNSREQFWTVLVRVFDILSTSSKVRAFAVDSLLIINPEMFKLAKLIKKNNVKMMKKKHPATLLDKDQRRKSSLDPVVCSKHVNDKMSEVIWWLKSTDKVMAMASAPLKYVGCG